MKYIFTTVIIAAFTLSAVAQDEREPIYMTRDEMPDALKWLPAPPDTMSPHFAYDIMQYMWGKTQRLDPVRGAIAIRDEEWGIGVVEKEFSEPFGMKISKENTPEIYKLLELSILTGDEMGKRPKEHYMRKRPFMRMQEPTSTPWAEKSLRRNGSYPSGHTILGWLTALILTEINPAQADTLLARGMMYGDSRVIVGAHWQSDVDAGRLMASVTYAVLHTNERFIKQMEKAKAEFRKRKAAMEKEEAKKNK